MRLPVSRLILLVFPLLTLPALAAPPAPAPENPATVLDITHIQDQMLANGLHIIIKSEPYWKAVALGLVVRTGAKDDPPGQKGLAHLVEHLLFEPTTPGMSLSLDVENLGGTINAETTDDFTQVNLAVASQFAPDLLPHLASMVFGAKFTDEQFAAEKAIVQREIADRGSQVQGRLDDLMLDLAFTQHPYRLGVTGAAADVDKLTADQARQFYQAHYAPGNMALVAVGDLDPTSFFALARQHFGAVPQRDFPPENLPVEPAQTASRTKLVNLPVGNTVFRYAWHAPGVTDEAGVCCMDLLYTALSRGETALLTKSLAQPGLALTSSCEFLTQKYPGLFEVTVVTSPDKELPARQALLGVIARLRDKPFSPDELAYVKKLLYADYAFDNQSYPDQVGSLSFYEAIDSYKFAANYLGAVYAITPDQLQAAARQYLRDDNFSLVVIRPQGAQPEGENV